MSPCHSCTSGYHCTMYLAHSRIPLIPRRPGSPDAGGASKTKPKPKGKDAGDDTPPPPTDPDEKLLHDALYMSIQAIDKLVSISGSVLL